MEPSGKEEIILEVIDHVSAVTLTGLDVPFSVHLWWWMALTLAGFGVDVPLEQPMTKT